MSSEYPNKQTSSWFIPKKPSSKRSWLIISACLCTILVHLLLICLCDYGLISMADWDHPPKKQAQIIYDLALNDPRTMKFVDTNPYLSPQEAPETDNYAAKSQRAAQEIPSKTENSDIPTLNGDLAQILKIVPDQLVTQEDLLEIVNFSPEIASPGEVSIEIKEQKIDIEGPKVAIRPQPKPRQRVKPFVGGMRKSSSATQNLGIAAVDARFNQFGVYQQKMYEAIGCQWHFLIADYRITNEDFGGKVLLSYTINPEGNITNLSVKESTTSNLLTLICKDAILSLGSFGLWNEDMIKVLGKEQTFNVGFIFR